jgi:hypothetical protein
LLRVVTLPTDDRLVNVPRGCRGHGGRDAVDPVDVGDAHLVEQPPRVRRHRLHVSPLRLGVQHAERERRLARPRHAREHHQRIAGDVDVHVLEVVLAPRTRTNAAGRA